MKSRVHQIVRNDQSLFSTLDPSQQFTLQLSLLDVMESAKEGLMALAVQTGLRVIQLMMREEVEALVGPKGKHNPKRKAVRHGKEKGSVMLGGRKVAVEKVRVRSVDGHEIPLETYQAFQDPTLLTQAALERMIHGLSTRNYAFGLEPVGNEVETSGTSKSAVSRRFIAATKKLFEKLMQRRLDDRRYVALVIDGIVMADHTVVAALGIDVGGQKQILGVWEGATENATVCKGLLTDLVDRGLKTDDGILVVIDGSKALRAAVRDVFGETALVQRCQVHKERNVLEHLPEKQRDWVKRQLREAWRQETEKEALAALRRLAAQLEKAYPGAAASLREGMEETVTVIRLGVPELLRGTLRSTNAIESANEKVRMVSRNVKRWQNGEQVLRWAAAGFLEVEKKFRTVKGFRQIPLLLDALHKCVHPQPQQENKSITA
ncbi:IS256 family transposase [Kyrpidia spormannii]|nr:IS256 family transposase [Kyrpidia spormannii]